MASFAAFVLARCPALAERLARRDVAGWLAAQESMEIDGERMWLVGGDRLVDEPEMKLGWAREHGLADAALLRRLSEDYRREHPDEGTIEVE